MPRRSRIHFPGATYHVIIRGNNKQDIFTCDSERRKFYSLINEGVERFEHQVIAFCLMSNHVHLAVKVNDIPLAEVIQNLSFRYTRSFNFRHRRIGHLFQGRYKAILVDSEAYLRELVRYIHLNPVRAKIVSDPAEYKWSGHRAYVGLDSLPWLATDVGLEAFSYSSKSAVDYYNAFVISEVDPSEWVKFEEGTKGSILGDEEFVAAVNQLAPRITRRKKTDLDSVVSTVCAFYGIEFAALSRSDHTSSRLRAVAALLARCTQGVSIRELADYIGIDERTLGKAASRLEGKIHKSEELKEEFGQLIDKLPSKADY
jgi:REP-associated tyrosine transposase